MATSKVFMIGYQRASYELTLQRTCQLLREHLGFFCGVARADPVTGARGVLRFGNEDTDLGSQVLLCRVEGLAFAGADISLRDLKTLAGLLLCGGGLRGAQLRRELRDVRFRWRLILGRGSGAFPGPGGCTARDDQRGRQGRKVQLQVWNNVTGV